ncbi:MAG: hypothetical protein VR69_01345 [Peptococcaceae bacterium BRH_c4b]|nr:MAG: hypothetical protein VR69_01345 [Peptococcaceae bacterium BRH_c4b]
MPRFDGTGPAGSGKMTGRGMGKCMGVNGMPGDRENTGQGFVRRIGQSLRLGLGACTGRGPGRRQGGAGANGK